MEHYITLVLAIFVAAIAFLQWRTARNRLSLDLYNKRFDIYVTILDLHQAVFNGSAEEMEAAATPFVRSFRESQFLFRRKDGIYDTLKKIKNANAQMVPSKKEPESLKLLNAARQGRKDFDTLLLTLEQQLDSYLGFRRLK